MKAGTPGSYYETCCVSPHKGQGPNFEEKRELNDDVEETAMMIIIMAIILGLMREMEVVVGSSVILH